MNKIQLQSEITSTCNQIAVTLIHDKSGRPYWYVANKEAGLKIYNLSNPAIENKLSSTSNILFVDIPGFEAAVYFVRLLPDNGIRYSRKRIFQKIIKPRGFTQLQ